MSQTNEAQFIGSIPTVNTEMETRQITLPRETWEELDKLAENCPVWRNYDEMPIDRRMIETGYAKSYSRN